MKMRGTFGSFLRLPPAARWLALEAALLLALARTLVLYVPLRHWRGRLDTSGGADRTLAVANARAVGRVVRGVARRLPFDARCLPRAMAAQWMLRRRRIASQLRFGVRRRTDGTIDLHAWLLVNGECVVGGWNLETYAPLPAFDGGAHAAGRPRHHRPAP